MLNKLGVTLIIILMLPRSAFAYLDPGTGSMLFSAFIGIVATLMFVFKSLICKIKHLPSYIIGKKIKRTNHECEHIVFYSEGGQYWYVFKPVIEELYNRRICCTYVSSDEKDPGIQCGLDTVRSHFIPEGNKLFFYLNTLEADMVVMTTPQLDVLQIKRSKGVKHYCHITHSAGGCSDYRVYGLDYFDSVLTGGEGDIREIREIESKRPISHKECVPIGCTYLDILRKRMKEDRKAFFGNSNKIILLAPTWGTHGLLSKYGDVLLKALYANTDYNIIVRPHPQSYKIEGTLINDLKNRYAASHIIWDSSDDNFDSMMNADIMVSDFSGVIFDFLFLFEKPFLSISAKHDNRARDSMDLEEPCWVIQTLQRMGNILDEKNIPDIISIISDHLKNPQALKEIIEKARTDMDKYPGESGKRGADFIELKLKLISELEE